MASRPFVGHGGGGLAPLVAPVDPFERRIASLLDRGARQARPTGKNGVVALATPQGRDRNAADLWGSSGPWLWGPPAPQGVACARQHK